MKVKSFPAYHLICIIVFLLVIPNLHAQAVDKLTPDIEVVKVSDLNFGTFTAPDTSNGRVTIGTDGNYDMLNTYGTFIFSGQPFSAAEFEITGTKNNKLIKLTVELTTWDGPPLTLNSIVDPLPLDNLRKNEVTWLKIGGVLDLPVGTTAGSYSGTITITFINN